MSRERVSGLGGAELDYWVAKAQDWDQSKESYDEYHGSLQWVTKKRGWITVDKYVPSTGNQQTYDLIEEFKVDVLWEGSYWAAFTDSDGDNYTGNTPAEAICRAVVASVFGEYV